MPKSMKKMILLAKAEVTPGLDPVPTPALNAILVRGMTPTPISAEFVERNLLRGYKGNFGSLSVGVHRQFECEVELAGSGAAGTAPKWAPLLQACGFSETLLATTSATYAPVSEAEPTLTMYGYLDGLLFKLTGAKGTVSFELNAKNIPVMKFKFVGDYSAYTDVTFPTGAVFTGFTKPVTVSKVNTPTLTMFGFAAVCNAFGFDIANAVAYRDEINYQGAESPDRKPVGTATIELPTAAIANFGEIARLNAESAVNLVHGTVAGNIIDISMPNVQLNSPPTISNDGDKARIGLQYSLNPSAGNDEVVIVVR